MPLQKQVIDIYPTGLSQLPSDRTGGVGRMTDIRNAQYKHYDPGTPSKPQYLNLAQRNAFTSKATTGHSVTSGATESLAWQGPRFLSCDSAGTEISINRSKPRVWDGTDWASHTNTRVITNKLNARPWYSNQSVMQAPTQSWLNGVTCAVTTEVTQASNLSDTSISTIIAGFRADNKTWIRTPFVVKAAGSAGKRCMARVVNDGTNFWIFVGHSSGGTGKIDVYVFDQNGQALASNTTHININSSIVPGYWDVIRRPATSEIVLVQTTGNDVDHPYKGLFIRMTQSAGTITFTDQVDDNILSTNPVKWAKNFQDSELYLFTGATPTSGSGNKLHGYKVSVIAGTMQSVHHYQFGIDTVNPPDTIIGYTEASTDGNGAHKNLVLSYGEQSVTSSYGASYDPALRYIKSYRCKWDDTVTFLRQTDSVCQVSDAFVIDDDWYAFTYYQSGSGEGEPDLIDYEIQGGDYMLGAAEQPIKTQAGDLITGSVQNFAYSPSQGTGIRVTNAQAAVNILATGTPDSVVPVTLSNIPGFPNGFPAFLWTFQNLSNPINAIDSILRVSGSSITLANFDWDIISVPAPGPTTQAYTPITNRVGGTLTTTGNFTTSGTVEVVSTTLYTVPDLFTTFVGTTPDLLKNTDAVVTGNATGGNNGTFTVDSILAYPGSTTQGFARFLTTTQVTTNTSYSIALTATGTANVFGFNAEITDAFDDSYIGSSLATGDVDRPENNGTFVITDGDNKTLTVTSSILKPEYTPSAITDKVILDLTKHQYTFFLQDASFDYTFQNAIISVVDAKHPENTGLYRIIQIVDSDTVYTQPISNPGIPRNELFTDPPTNITILKQATVSPQIQPQWFITPIGEVTTAQVGNCELGLAYADWRRESLFATIPPNPYPMHVSSPELDNDGISLTLPFRAVTVTEQSATVIGGLTNTSAIAAAVIGTKQFKIATNVGQASFGTAMGDLIPGTLAVQYDGGRFTEAGITVGLEQPVLLSEQTATNPGLTKNFTYSYVACLEAQDAKGNRIWTAPSPALEVVLSGDNDSITITGHLPVPLGSTGDPVAGNYYGLSNRVRLVLSMYRTCNRNGLATTGHYKITDDLAANATTPISATNDSGFSFPDQFTYTYKDENLDSVVLSNELLYTDQGQLPRFHPPAFQQGTQGWQERDWLVAYDGAIWFDGAHIEGEAAWYTPLFRVPAPFEPTAVANLESFLAGFALDSKWYLPNFTPPVNSAVKIPSWQHLPLEGGCTGILTPATGGVIYASNFGGAWKMTRDLRDEWQSQDMLDDLTPLTITSMVVDKKRRLHVLTTADKWFMYDEVSRRWSRWVLPGSAVGTRLACIVDGVVNAACTGGIYAYDETSYADVLFGATTGCPLGFDMASLQFGNVGGVKRLYQLQLRGKYKGPHNITSLITVPDQNPTTSTVTDTITPSSTRPYVLDLYPGPYEESSSWGVSVDADFTNFTPGNSFELDVISAEVGLDTRAGINRSVQELAQS